MPVLAPRAAPSPDPVDLALAVSLRRFVGSKSCPKYLRDTAISWLAKHPT